MTYMLCYESLEVLNIKYSQVRKIINPLTDAICLLPIDPKVQNVDTKEIYKHILKLDGKYRSKNNNWTGPKVMVRVLN